MIHLSKQTLPEQTFMPQATPSTIPTSTLISGIRQKHANVPFVNLAPGKIFISHTPTIVSTILGSCVAVCMHHKRLGVGAICHSLLPTQVKESGKDNFPYVDMAVSHMLETLRNKFGIKAEELTIKLFGGANVLQVPVNREKDAFLIGAHNIEAAEKALSERGLTAAVRKVGGTKGYKIFFNTATGEVFMRYITPESTKNYARKMRGED